MKVEFCFNSRTSLRLIPEGPKDKQLLQLFCGDAELGVKISSASRDHPESLNIDALNKRNTNHVETLPLVKTLEKPAEKEGDE